MSNPAEYAAAMRKAGDAQARELLERVRECLDKERCDKFEDCIAWARLKYDISLLHAPFEYNNLLLAFFHFLFVFRYLKLKWFHFDYIAIK